MRRYSEFEVQAHAYWCLMAAFPLVRGEYKFPPTEHSAGARVDLAIFDSRGNLALVIEVKKSEGSHSESQGERYSRVTGVPCMYIRGMEQAKCAPELVGAFLRENNIVIS